MESEDLTKPGMDSQGSDELGQSATFKLEANKSTINIPIPQTLNPNSPTTFKLKPSVKGVENAKKRLRAFSIQKKTPITALSVNKSVTGNKTSGSGSTVFIGKLSGVKVTPKSEDAEQKKLPKPPKPGHSKKYLQDSYTDLQKRTLSEIEDMKRKMELVDLGIPLGLICPTAQNEKAMPTKAMPPIKSFLDPAKLDAIISEAKKAKAQGKEFKFDYQKLLPDYDNPFQRKKEEVDAIRKQEYDRESYKKHDKERRKSDKYDRDSRQHYSHRKDERDRRRDEKDTFREKSREKETKKEAKKETKKPVEKETDVNLNDYLVCDSWSLENEDKTNSSSPKHQETPQSEENKTKVVKEIATEPEEVNSKLNVTVSEKKVPNDSPKTTPVRKIKRLQPVIDSFKFEIDPDEDEVLDIFDENSELEKYTKVKQKKDEYDSPFGKIFDLDQSSKDASNDALTDDTFLESVINEIKQDVMCDEANDDASQDKGLVEYDSPTRDCPTPKDARSVTPELDDRMREVQSSRSDYSDGYRSTESGYKSTESGYKSNNSYKSDSNSDNYRMSMEKELVKMPKATVDSLEIWSFVLKICQPLLFRHDRNKCYRETHSLPKIWYTVNPKLCSCVKDRAIVYEELETCKMGLVDRVYGCDQIQESEFPKARGWYPRFAQCLLESTTLTTVAPSIEWEADDSQTETPLVKEKSYKTNRSTTPVRSEEIYLDREYQRFMEAVWPEVAETRVGTPRSTTPVKQDARKKKAEDTKDDDKKKAKKIKLCSEGWSQESDVEEDIEKTKKTNKIQKMDKVKVRKRKRSSSLSDSDSNSNKKRKASKKATKKTKSKLTKHRRLSKKYLKKLKDKQKKKKRFNSDDEDMDKENRKREKKLKKKKLQKKKKTQKKKKSKASSSSSSSSTSSSSSSETSSDSESDTEIRKKKKKSDVKKKKRKQSSSESTHSEDLFDVNVLNNIKTERLTDDEKKLEFSNRKQKPREIINVKELQNDFVGSVQIKKEVEAIAEKQKIQELELVTQREEEFVTDTHSHITENNSESISLSLADRVCPSVTKTVSQSIAETVPQNENKPFCQSVTESVCQSTAENEPQNVNKTLCQSVKDIVCEEARDSASQSLNESVIDRDPKTVSESISQKVPEIVPTVVSATILENIPVPKEEQITQFKEPLDINRLTPSDRPDVTQPEELSQCSSQESTASKDPYEKDDSHLRPSSQNSNYSFNDVINASHNYQKEEEDKFEQDNYEDGNYEMYEQLAMAYQSDVAKQGNFQSPVEGQPQGQWWGSQRIETVVRVRARGEIKCDWRAGCPPPSTAALAPHRPSRWGLKPGEVNIVLTGGNNEVYPIHNVVEPVYQIQTLANNRVDNSSTGSYDEAYEDMYGASDRLQYGDCFATDVPQIDISPTLSESKKPLTTTSSLDERIDRALRTTVLGEVAKDTEEPDADKEAPEKGILLTKASRGVKRVSFADGYKPGQDSDVEEPPKRKKKPRRFGCAWPCPASHPDHVPLWDALPPPPPPPGSPPPFFTQQAPNMLPQQMIMQQPPPMMQQQSSQMLQQQPPQMLQQQQSQMLQQPPPQMLQQQPPQLLPQQTPQLLQQQPPQMLQQQPPRMMQQQPPHMMQPQPPQMIQQQLMQQQQLLQQQGINPAMLQAPPFAMGQKIDPNVSLPNFMPPEPPPGLISF
ncbi:unnamed protein product [Arctia plantaginis]|uniref:Uncharacterized protein n=1 Tax=Arctia plantaginis TaxID=874455 RepID=A0A8S0ZKV9_ARCPL|nr:unnamed protein product [Arctia plantaginis]